MAIKYKFIKTKDKEEIGDRIISKTGHTVLFTLNNVKRNEDELIVHKKTIEKTIKPVLSWLKENKMKIKDEEMNAISMYREATLIKEEAEKLLKTDLTTNEIKELTATVKHNEAVQENILYHHDYVAKYSVEEQDKINTYHKTKLQIIAYQDKLKEINDALAISKTEKEEIYKQLKLK